MVSLRIKSSNVTKESKRVDIDFEGRRGQNGQREELVRSVAPVLRGDGFKPYVEVVTFSGLYT